MQAGVSVDMAKIDSLKQKLATELNIDLASFSPIDFGLDKKLFPALDQASLDGDISSELLAKTIDHTILKPEALPDQIETLSIEARNNGFYSVCVNGGYVKKACEFLYDTDVAIAAVVGFPLGQMSTSAKAFEAKSAVLDGATEIDMVINVGWLKSGDYKAVYQDIKAVTDAAEVPVKVIIETCLLSDEEKIIASCLSVFAGAAFVKTSTGFSSGGATLHDIALMRTCVGDFAGVKASGGIKTYDDAVKMLKAGANRIGTSSGIQIINK